eukprot:14667019-Alexandrium_andersonii.AAC.1
MPPAKYAVVQTIQRGAVSLGLPARGRFAEPLWGGHALWRGGAQHLGAAGARSGAFRPWPAVPHL